MQHTLAGKRVLITQCTEFMGSALCEVFREQGAEVVASADPLTPPEAAARVVREAGPIDVLVANLAFTAPTTPATQVSQDEWRDTFAAKAERLLFSRVTQKNSPEPRPISLRAAEKFSPSNATCSIAIRFRPLSGKSSIISTGLTS